MPVDDNAKPCNLCGDEHQRAVQAKALIMISFVNILLDKSVITNAMFTALLLKRLHNRIPGAA